MERFSSRDIDMTLGEGMMYIAKEDGNYIPFGIVKCAEIVIEHEPDTYARFIRNINIEFEIIGGNYD